MSNKPYFFFFWLCVIGSFAQAQTPPKVVEVSVARTASGYAPAFQNVSRMTKKQASLYKGLPTGFTKYFLRCQSLQQYADHYQALHDGRLSPRYYRLYAENMGVDSLTKPCTLQPFKHHVGIWIGFKGGNKHIRIDSNNDFSFLDEREWVYDTLYPVKNIPYDSLPTLKVQYEYFDGKDIIPRSTHIKFYPFENSNNILPIYTAIHENFAGSCRYDGTTYHFKIGNRHYGIDDIFPNSELLFLNGKDSLETKLGDFFTFDGKYWRVEIGEGRAVRVHCLGKESEQKVEGVQKHFYLPAYHYESIDHEKLSIPAKNYSYTILYFWSSASKRFKEDIIKLKYFSEKYEHKIDFIGLAYERDVETVRQFLAEHEISHPQLFESMEGESDMAWRSVFEIKRYPTYLLIDEAGKIRERSISLDAIEEAIQKLK